MSGKREARKADLQNRLIDAAEALIAAQGLSQLKARDVTLQAECALGALYTAFADLDMLVLHVNARTLTRLGQTLRAAYDAAPHAPELKMQALATTYARFALDETFLWDALFNHRVPAGSVPDWYKHAHAVLIELIVPPLRELRSDLSPEALVLRARTSFAAVHGVVQLSMQGRFVGVPRDALEGEVQALVLSMTRGAHLA